MVLDTIRQAFIFSNTKRNRAKSCILFHQWGLAQRDPVSPNPKKRTIKGCWILFFGFVVGIDDFSFPNTKSNKRVRSCILFCCYIESPSPKRRIIKGVGYCFLVHVGKDDFSFS